MPALQQRSCVPSPRGRNHVSQTTHNAKSKSPFSMRLHNIMIEPLLNTFDKTLVAVFGVLFFTSLVWLLYVFTTLYTRSMWRRSIIAEPKERERLNEPTEHRIREAYRLGIGAEFPEKMRLHGRHRERPDFVEVYNSEANGGGSGLLGGPYGSSGWRRVRRYDGTDDGGERAAAVRETTTVQMEDGEGLGWK